MSKRAGKRLQAQQARMLAAEENFHNLNEVLFQFETGRFRNPLYDPPAPALPARIMRGRDPKSPPLQDYEILACDAAHLEGINAALAERVGTAILNAAGDDTNL